MADSTMTPRDGKLARNSLKQFAQMMKGLMDLDEDLADYDSLDVAILAMLPVRRQLLKPKPAKTRSTSRSMRRIPSSSSLPTRLPIAMPNCQLRLPAATTT
jgi:hypothetical protein